jgi:hypothetical protein
MENLKERDHPFEDIRRMWEDNIKTGLKDIYGLA